MNSMNRRQMLKGLAALSIMPTPAKGASANNNIDKVHQHLRSPLGNLVLLAAHRGSWENFPENSDSAHHAAYLAGWDMVESDVRLTVDKKLIVSHDYSLTRVSNGTGFIYQKTYDEIRALVFRNRHGYPYTPAPGRRNGYLNVHELLQIHSTYLVTNPNGTQNGPLLILDIKGHIVNADDPNKAGEVIKLLRGPEYFGDASLLATKSVLLMFKRNLFPGGVAQFEAQTGYSASTPWPRVMLILNPDDPEIIRANYNPNNDADLHAWRAKPYFSHFEVNQGYVGDGLEQYIQFFINNGMGYSAYRENAYFPEGIANAGAKCCFTNSVDPSAPGFYDMKRDPELSVAHTGLSLIVSELPDETNALLKAKSLRNLNWVQ